MEKNIEQFLQETVDQNDIVLFMKGTSSFPQCGFSAAVVSILNKYGVKFHDVNVLESNELREGVKIFSDWPTIPQLYLKGEFVGGCDIVKELASTSEFEKMLKDKGILSDHK